MIWVSGVKEKISKLSKGIFEYELPGLVLSQQLIEFDVEEGKTYNGSITVSCSDQSLIKGLIYSTNHLFRIHNPNFSGAENVISYEFRAEGLSSLEPLKGCLEIVSCCGEAEIPFLVHVEAPYLLTSMGKIRDLFHFANLAKSEPQEALSLFVTEGFSRVFLEPNSKNWLIYQSVIKSANSRQALEEFLIAVHKKVRIKIVTNQNFFSYKDVKETFRDSVLLTKDTWGYEEFKVSTEGDFIVPEHNCIQTEHFLGNQFQFDFLIDKSSLRDGQNYGKIRFTSINQTIDIEINALCGVEKKKEIEQHIKKKYYESQLIQNYLDFRVGQIDKETYQETTMAMLDQFGEFEHPTRLDLFKTHLYLLAGDEDFAGQIVDRLIKEEDKIRQEDELDYLGYLYIKALYSKKEEDINTACISMRQYYEQVSWEVSVLWYLFYLDKKYDQNRPLKLEEIHKQFDYGCYSPILYFEACAVYNQEPLLFRELTRFEIQVMHFGIRNEYMSKEIVDQYTFLAFREKNYHPLIFKDLVLLYDRLKTTDILSAICRLLIKGQKTHNKYFKWYHLGVEAQLKITQLHEYYMYSINEEEGTPLLYSALLYFIYNSSLSERKKAFLYASVIKDKQNNTSIYRTYFKQIEMFAMKQIVKHNISNHLKIIYEDILITDMIKGEIAEELPHILFRHELTCHNPHIVGVYVVHKELNQEIYVPLTNGRAQFNMFTENAQLFLTDGEGNRYHATVEYTLNKFLISSKYIDSCYAHNARNYMLLINLSEKIENYQRSDKSSLEIQKLVCEIPNVNRHIIKKCNRDIIQYYYDNVEGDLLVPYLHRIDLDLCTNDERAKILEYMIIRNLDQKVLTNLISYGFEGISIKRLLKLCDRFITMDLIPEEQKEYFLGLCYHVFDRGKYDTAILQYLVEFYAGTTKKMYELWKIATDFEIETKELEERLLAQMLFTDNLSMNVLPLFISYYRRGKNGTLIRAAISYFSYKHLVNDRILHLDLIEIIKRESIFEENEVSMLALLKYYSSQEHLTEEEKKFVDFNLHNFIQKGKVLPIFIKFKDKIQIPQSIYDKFYIEHIANSKKKVKIHYIIENGENSKEYVTEIMQDTYYGIHVKEFILFYGETIQYYITEEMNDEQIITKSKSTRLENCFEQKALNRYGNINLMLMSKDMQDEETMIEIMENYNKTQSVMMNLFKPL